MKQHITIEDLKQLSPEQQEKLREWWQVKQYDIVALEEGPYSTIVCAYERNGQIFSLESSCHELGMQYFDKKWCLPLLSIGQMIQFIRDNNLYNESGDSFFWVEEPCDVIWNKIKKYL